MVPLVVPCRLVPSIVPPDTDLPQMVVGTTPRRRDSPVMDLPGNFPSRWMVVRGPISSVPIQPATISPRALSPKITPPGRIPPKTIPARTQSSTPLYSLSPLRASIESQQSQHIIQWSANSSSSEEKHLRLRAMQASNSPGTTAKELEKKIRRRQQKNESQRRLRALKKAERLVNTIPTADVTAAAIASNSIMWRPG